MDENFFFRYELCSKDIETEAVFTITETGNEWNANFVQNTSCVPKVSRLKLYLSREMKIYEVLVFFKIVFLGRNTLTPGSFALVEDSLKLHF